MNRLASILFLALATLLGISCNDCKSPMYVGISAAFADDTVVVLFDDIKVYEKTFSSPYVWSEYDIQHDLAKVVENYCPKDSLLRVQLKLINANHDTVFQINTNEIKGFYFSTPSAARGSYFVAFDYHDGGLRDILSY